MVHTRARKDGGERGEIVVVASKVEKERERTGEADCVVVRCGAAEKVKQCGREKWTN